MPRRTAATRRGVPRPAAGDHADEAGPVRDSVDRIVEEWAAQRPDLPVTPVLVLTRLSRVRTRMDEELAVVFARHDLTAADFTVIAALRRAGDPFTLPQSVLMGRLALTSGTVSVRLGRLERKQVVTRAPSADDGRGVLVTLTPRGIELFDQVAPEHLANEDVLLSALTSSERDQLADLLRTLLVGFEHPQSTSPLGFTVEPAHLARRARVAVGLSDRPGLLVHRVRPAGPADRAGLQTGDLILRADGQPAVSCVALARVTAAAGPSLRLAVLRGEDDLIIEVDSH